jgi:hypothetical protein
VSDSGPSENAVESHHSREFSTILAKSHDLAADEANRLKTYTRDHSAGPAVWSDPV